MQVPGSSSESDSEERECGQGSEVQRASQVILMRRCHPWPGGGSRGAAGVGTCDASRDSLGSPDLASSHPMFFTLQMMIRRKPSQKVSSRAGQGLCLDLRPC